MEVENKGKGISTEQRETMLEFMKAHPSLATGRFTAPDGAKHKARLLHELAAQLNSCSTGVTKSDDKWLKSWQDWRSDVKSKAALLKREMNKTGGGINKAKPLTPLEEQLLAYLGPNIVSGHDNVLDPLTPAATATVMVTAATEQGNSDEPLTFTMPDDTISFNLDGEPDMGALSVAGEVNDSGSGSSVGSKEAKKKSRKRKQSSSATSSLESECEDPLTVVAKKQLELDAVKVELKREQNELAKEQNELAKEQNEIAKRQLTAVEGACSAFSSAMIALKQYLDRH